MSQVESHCRTHGQIVTLACNCASVCVRSCERVCKYIVGDPVVQPREGNFPGSRSPPFCRPGGVSPSTFVRAPRHSSVTVMYCTQRVHFVISYSDVLYPSRHLVISYSDVLYPTCAPRHQLQ